MLKLGEKTSVDLNKSSKWDSHPIIMSTLLSSIGASGLPLLERDLRLQQFRLNTLIKLGSTVY